MKIATATASNNKNSSTIIIDDNHDENKENIPPSTILLIKSLSLDFKHDDDQNDDNGTTRSDGTTLLPFKIIDDTTDNNNDTDTANAADEERSSSGQTERLNDNHGKEEPIVVKDMKEGTVIKATVKQALLPKVPPKLLMLKPPKKETPPTAPPTAPTTTVTTTAARKVITLTVSPGRLGLSLKLNKSTPQIGGTSTTGGATGAIIVDIHPACAFIDKIDIGDCIISIDGKEVNNLDDFKLNCDMVRVFDVVKGMNSNNKKKMMMKKKKKEKTTTCNVVTQDKLLKNGDEKGGVDAMISNNGVLSTISNIYKRR